MMEAAFLAGMVVLAVIMHVVSVEVVVSVNRAIRLVVVVKKAVVTAVVVVVVAVDVVVYGDSW